MKGGLQSRGRNKTALVDGVGKCRDWSAVKLVASSGRA